MFCPKCSQQQISDETRFCSRCGFQLSVVKALLVNENDASPQNSEPQPLDRSLRKRDMTIGALLMFFFALVVAAITVDMPSSHSARIIGLVIAWLILSVLINIAPIIRYFVSGASPAEENESSFQTISNLTSKIKSRVPTPALPPAHSRPAADFVTERINTADLVQPPSVTEKTTSLLNNNQHSS